MKVATLPEKLAPGTLKMMGISKRNLKSPLPGRKFFQVTCFLSGDIYKRGSFRRDKMGEKNAGNAKRKKTFQNETREGLLWGKEGKKNLSISM